MPADPLAKHCRRSLSTGSVVLDRFFLAWIAISRSCLAVPGIWKTKALIQHGCTSTRQSAETCLSIWSIPNPSLARCWQLSHEDSFWPSISFSLYPSIRRGHCQYGPPALKGELSNHPVINPNANMKVWVRICCLQCTNTVKTGGRTSRALLPLHPWQPCRAFSAWPRLHLIFPTGRAVRGKVVLSEGLFLMFAYVLL